MVHPICFKNSIDALLSWSICPYLINLEIKYGCTFLKYDGINTMICCCFHNRRCCRFWAKCQSQYTYVKFKVEIIFELAI